MCYCCIPMKSCPKIQPIFCADFWIYRVWGKAADKTKRAALCCARNRARPFVPGRSFIGSKRGVKHRKKQGNGYFIRLQTASA